MARLYDLAARASAMAAVLCAVLALMSSPALVRADQDANCEKQCGMYLTGSDDHANCMAECIQGPGGKCAGTNYCDNGCDAYPNCEPKTCNPGKSYCQTCDCWLYVVEELCRCK
jgi:uncharacterized membrane protein